MSNAQRDIMAYNLAKQFLTQFPGVTEEVLKERSRPLPRPDAISVIYFRMLSSAQNANMKSGVVGSAIGGVDKLGTILCGFQPKAVLEKYSSWEDILDDVRLHLKPNGKILTGPRSIWPKYCKTILSAADFMIQFETAEEFYKWVDSFHNDIRAREALPLLLAKKVDGLGFALSCDFLKELGYINFAKPDIHIQVIFKGLKLCDTSANEYQVFDAVVSLSKNVGVTPYEADKIFWLIGSGNFSEHKHIGNNGKLGRNRDRFIEYAKYNGLT